MADYKMQLFAGFFLSSAYRPPKRPSLSALSRVRLGRISERRISQPGQTT
jgi:hypothetical protein